MRKILAWEIQIVQYFAGLGNICAVLLQLRNKLYVQNCIIVSLSDDLDVVAPSIQKRTS